MIFRITELRPTPDDGNPIPLGLTLETANALYQLNHVLDATTNKPTLFHDVDHATLVAGRLTLTFRNSGESFSPPPQQIEGTAQRV